MRALRVRIDELENSRDALQQDHSDALALIATLRTDAANHAATVLPSTAEAERALPAFAAMSSITVDTPATEPAPLKTVSPGDDPAVVPAAEERPATIALSPRRVIAPETATEALDARPIGPLQSSISAFTPAPIFDVTPLRAPGLAVATIEAVTTVTGEMTEEHAVAVRDRPTDRDEAVAHVHNIAPVTDVCSEAEQAIKERAAPFAAAEMAAVATAAAAATPAAAPALP